LVHSSKKGGKWLLQYTSPDGNKITISIEGSFNVEKIKQLVELVELTGLPGDNYSQNEITDMNISHKRNSIKESLIILLEKEFKDRWFTTKDVVDAYYKYYGERLPLNTISSYLSRLNHSGILSCKGSRINRMYRISLEALNSM
jgi:hypothetical protein